MGNKISKKGAAALGAGLMSLSLTGFAGLLMLAPGAQATEDPGTDATVKSEVKSQEECGWTLVGAATEIELVPATDETRYEDAALPLTATFAGDSTLNLYVTGNAQAQASRTAHTECIFYSVANPGVLNVPKVTIEVEGAFTSATLDDTDDDSLSFTPGVEDAADLTVTGATLDVDACVEDDFVVSTVEVASGETGTLLSMLKASVNEKATEADTQRCDLGYVVGVTIPGGLKPSAPGAIYTWTGLNLTTVMTPSATD
jgi:hypothetical protein